MALVDFPAGETAAHGTGYGGKFLAVAAANLIADEPADVGEVAVVEVAVKYSETVCPATESFA